MWLQALLQALALSVLASQCMSNYGVSVNLELFVVPCSDAKTDIKNDDGKIPIEVAELNEQEAAVKALKEGKSATAKSDKSGKEPSDKKKAQDSKQDVYL